MRCVLAPSFALQIKVGDNNTKQPGLMNIKGEAAGRGRERQALVALPPWLTAALLAAALPPAGRVMWAFWDAKKGMSKEQVT